MQIICSGNFRGFRGLGFNHESVSAIFFFLIIRCFLDLYGGQWTRSDPGLLRSFKPCRKDSCQILLSNPTGPLSKKLDSSAIEEANKEVTAVIAITGGKHQLYLKLTDEQWATIWRYAAEHGTVNAICHFKEDFPKDSLKESTIHGWKNAFYRNFNHGEERGRQSGKTIA